MNQFLKHKGFGRVSVVDPAVKLSAVWYGSEIIAGRTLDRACMS